MGIISLSTSLGVEHDPEATILDLYKKKRCLEKVNTIIPNGDSFDGDESHGTK